MNRLARGTLCLMLAAMLFALGACSSHRNADMRANTASTLPPAASPYTAPTDDSGLGYEAPVSLYLPSLDGQRLLARQTSLALQRGGANARTVIQALMDARTNERTKALAEPNTLRFSGNSPVEVSGNVCTVNLVGSAQALEYDEMYTLCLALASTLADSTAIRYVNLLVEDMPVSYDTGGNLPAGSVTAHPGEELPVMWDQMESRRTPLGSPAASQPLSATATLYFPLKDGSGFVAEARNLTFAGQSPAMLTSGLLSALSAGPQVASGCASFPDIPALLALPASVSEAEGGGRLIELYFREDLEEILEAQGIGMAMFVATVNWTLSTFIPALKAVRFTIGTTTLTSVSGEPFGTVTFQNGQTERRYFREGLRAQDRIFMIRGGRLTPVMRSAQADTAGNPRVLLNLMARGTTAAESAAGYTAPLPSGLYDSDIIGISIEGDTLLLNLSIRFASAITRMGENAQRLCCYAIVNSLCDALTLTRVRFYWEGSVRGLMGTGFDWSGEFMLNHALSAP